MVAMILNMHLADYIQVWSAALVGLHGVSMSRARVNYEATSIGETDPNF